MGSARGMVLISRSEARGRVFMRRAPGGRGIGVVGALGSEGAVCRALSSHAARAAGSMGQVIVGSSAEFVIVLGSGFLVVEENDDAGTREKN